MAHSLPVPARASAASQYRYTTLRSAGALSLVAGPPSVSFACSQSWRGPAGWLASQHQRALRAGLVPSQCWLWLAPCLATRLGEASAGGQAPASCRCHDKLPDGDCSPCHRSPAQPQVSPGNVFIAGSTRMSASLTRAWHVQRIEVDAILASTSQHSAGSAPACPHHQALRACGQWGPRQRELGPHHAHSRHPGGAEQPPQACEGC